MNIICSLSVLILTGICTTTCHAAIMLSFNPQTCSWFATHVVVAESAPHFDGNFTILESWLGDLKAGDKLYLQGLAVFAREQERTIHNFPSGGSPQQHVTGKRVILYLFRKANSKVWEAPCHPNRFKLPEQIDTSVAFIEQSGVFGRSQFINPGPYVMMRVFKTEQEAQEQFHRIRKVKESYQVAIAHQQTPQRVAAIRQLMLSDPPRLPNATLIYQQLLREPDISTDLMKEILRVTPDLDKETAKLLERFQQGDPYQTNDKYVTKQMITKPKK